jgi:hypothetical protein
VGRERKGGRTLGDALEERVVVGLTTGGSLLVGVVTEDLAAV